MEKENGVLTNVDKNDLILLKNNPQEFWKGVTTIGNQAFKKCRNLESISIPNTVTKIGWEAFNHCSYLTSIIIPESVEIIGREVFNCNEINKVVFKNPYKITFESNELLESMAFMWSGLKYIYCSEEDVVFSKNPDYELQRTHFRTELTMENLSKFFNFKYSILKKKSNQEDNLAKTTPKEREK